MVESLRKAFKSSPSFGHSNHITNQLKDLHLLSAPGQLNGDSEWFHQRNAIHPPHLGNLLSTFEYIMTELTLSDEARAAREDVIRNVRREIQAFLRSVAGAAIIFADAPVTVEVFGSVASGLDIPSSDIDFGLLPSSDLAPDETTRLLRGLARFLRGRGLPTRLVPARIPVVQVKAAGGFECDVSVQDALSLHKAALLRAYNRADARFGALFRAIKHWARRRGLNDAFRGTLNSFAYALLTIQFLQTRRPPILPCLHAVRIVDPAGRVHDLPPPVARVRGLEVRFFGASPDGTGPAGPWPLDNFGAPNPAPTAALLPPLLGFVRELLDRRDAWTVSVRTGAPVPRPPEVAKGPGGVAAAAAGGGGGRGYLRIEDPFDPADNVARSLGPGGGDRLRAELDRALRVLRESGDMRTVCAPAAGRA